MTKQYIYVFIDIKMCNDSSLIFTQKCSHLYNRLNFVSFSGISFTSPVPTSRSLLPACLASWKRDAMFLVFDVKRWEW